MRSVRASACVAVLALLLMPRGASAMSLDDALQSALRRDAAWLEAVASYEANVELAPQLRAALRPQVDVSVGAAVAHTETDGVFGQSEDDYPTWSAGIEVRQALFRLDWNAIHARADAQTRRAEAAVDAGLLDLQARVAERYFNVLIAQRALEAAVAEARSVRRSLQDTQRRYDVELVAGTDLREAQARDDLAQAALIVAEREVETARDLLAESTGASDAPLWQLPAEVEFPPLEPADLEAWLMAARENSPQLRDARAQREVADSEVTTQRAALAPQVDLVGALGRDDSSEYVFGQRQDDARLSVQLRVPLYSGGGARAAIRESEARLSAAEAAQLRVEREVERSVRQAHRDLRSARIEARAYALALESARVAETAVRNGYQAGTRTIADVLDAQSAVVDAQLNLERTRYAVLINLVRLKRFAGVLDGEDLAALDALLVAPPQAPAFGTGDAALEDPAATPAPGELP